VFKANSFNLFSSSMALSEGKGAKRTVDRYKQDFLIFLSLPLKRLSSDSTCPKIHHLQMIL